MSETPFDLCVIGSGPAGFAAVMRAIDFGKRVCLVERADMGGAGVLWGALASKTMWELSKDYACAARVDRGYRAAGLTVDFLRVRDTVVNAARDRQLQMLSQVESFHPARAKGGSVELVRGSACFTGPQSLEVSFSDGSRRTIEANDYIIATGSRPRAFPGVEVDHQRVFDTNSILKLEQFPKRLLVIGAGIIGCEYATIFGNYGQTEVHLLDHASRILPFEDPDISNYISHNLEDIGVHIHHHARLRELRKHPDHLEAVVDFNEGHSRVILVDVALVCIGRSPNTEGIGLEDAGVTLTARGAISVDNQNRCGPHIFAVGDVAGKSHLANVGEMEGRYAVRVLFDSDVKPLRYDNMSTIMFFKPEVAAVGLNEQDAQQKGIPYRVSWFSNQLLPRAISMRATGGFVKILVYDDGSGRVLGMRAAGPQASSLIMSVSLLMDQQRSVTDYMQTIHPHPCMTESIQECLRLLVGKSVFKPEAFPEFLKVGSWAPDSCKRS